MTDPLLDASLVQSIGWALVHFVWQGTVIGCVYRARRCVSWRSARPSTRYLVACVGLALMLLVPMSAVFTGRPAEPLGVLAGGRAAADVVPPVPVDRLLPAAVLVWLVGVALLSIRLVAACVGIERLKRATRDVDETVSARVRALADRLGVARSIRVFESTMVRVPTVVGYLRPVILLPASVIVGLPPAHLDAVLAHELAHVRRHDYLVNVLQSVVETLLFYHPAVWWCSRQIRIEREHCCDDVVVEACGDRVAYATALAQLEELRGLNPMLSLNATGGRLIDRIRRVLGASPVNERRSTTWTIAAALTVVVAAIVLTPVRSIADTADRDVVLQADGRPSEPPPAAAASSAPAADSCGACACCPGSPRRATCATCASGTGHPGCGGTAVSARTADARRACSARAACAACAAAGAARRAGPLASTSGTSCATAAATTDSRHSSHSRLDPDSIHELVKSATQQIAESFEELRRATEEVGLKQEAIRQAQAEAGEDANRVARRQDADRSHAAGARRNFSAKKRPAQFDSREMQKPIDELQQGTREAARALAT